MYCTWIQQLHFFRIIISISVSFRKPVYFILDKTGSVSTFFSSLFSFNFFNTLLERFSNVPVCCHVYSMFLFYLLQTYSHIDFLKLFFSFVFYRHILVSIIWNLFLFCLSSSDMFFIDFFCIYSCILLCIFFYFLFVFFKHIFALFFQIFSCILFLFVFFWDILVSILSILFFFYSLIFCLSFSNIFCCWFFLRPLYLFFFFLR